MFEPHARDRARLLGLWKRAHRAAIHPILCVLLPSRCLGCEEPLGPVQHLGACPGCWAGLAPLLPPLCRACGIPLPSGTDLLGPTRGRCPTCLLSPLPLDEVRAAVAYDALARRFLLRAKLAGRREILPVLGMQLSNVLVATGFAAGCTIVAPVPSHPWSFLRRGFNPALEIARSVSRRLELPVRSLLRRRFLRIGDAKKLPARERASLVSGAFSGRGAARGARVLLVDDVMTSGATLAECARVLRASGALEIRGAIWARTSRPSLATPRSPFDPWEPSRL